MSFLSTLIRRSLAMQARRSILFLVLGDQMSPRASELTSASSLSDVAGAVSLLGQQLDYREQTDAERRKVDDARHETLIKGQDRIAQGQDELVSRVDSHGLRTTAIETRWEAFFGPQGAFGLVMKGIDTQSEQIKAQTKVSNRTNWILAIGVGIVLAAQFFVPMLRGH
jgi:hypothetical protein